MIDTPAYGWESAPQRSRVEEYAERVRTAPSRDRWQILAGSVQWRVRSVYRRATVGVVPRRLSDQFAVFRAHHERMLRRYVPTGTYGGAVLVLRADENVGAEHDLGWSRWVTGPVTTAYAPGRHVRLLREPWVDGVAQAVNQAIGNTAPDA
jgi:hypothetical protein